MKAIILALFLTSFSVIGQIDLQLNFPTPLVLISGAEYSVSIPENTDSCQYQLIGNGITVEKNDNSIIMKPLQGLNEIYSVELIKITNLDTNIINTQLFEVMLLPDPLLSLGEFGTEYLFSCHQDSLSKINRFELIPSWQTSQDFEWTNVKVEAYINGVDQIYQSKGTTLNQDFLDTLAKRNTQNKVTFRISMTHAHYMRTVVFNRRIRPLTNEQYIRKYNPFLDLHRDKRVEYIGPGSFEKYDTITMSNPGDLFIHCVALGTENNYTFESLSNDEVISINVMSGGPRELLDFRKKKGRYKVTLFGDGGYGELVLIIE